MLRLCVAMCVLALAGCASDFEKFYRSARLPPPPSVQPVPFHGEPKVTYASSNIRQDIQNMYKDGYGLIGQSSFNGPSRNPSGALEQAKKVGAEIVMLSSSYRNTVSGAIPLTLPTSNTSFSSGTVNAYGAGGSGTATYSGTTTTYGTQTTYIPYSIDRYDQLALYFMPLERRGMGMMAEPLSDEQHQALGTNKGVVVTAVRKGGPAFGADMLAGDIIISISGRGVFDASSFSQAAAAAFGTDAEVDFIRDGKPARRTISIPAGEW